MKTINRRNFVARLGLGLATVLSACRKESRPPRILVRSSWQTINIGDIAHTPGLLSLLEQYIPQAEVWLWPSSVDNGVDRLLLNRFPKLKIVTTDAAIEEAFNTCDFLLHGSGASLVAQGDVQRWFQLTGKPFGIYGITFPPKMSHKTKPESETSIAQAVSILSEADFVFFRDSKSLEFAKQKGCSSPVMEFGPDAAFACDLRNDELAKSFLKQHNLEPQKFLCCIPRLRYTPSWMIPSKNQAIDEVKHASNEAMKEHDHAPLRAAIANVVEQTDLKVLICPEDQTQMKVGKELLYDQLPEEIRKNVVWRPNYWLTGEAISTYVQSAGLFGNEMHSPIMCIGHGIPAIVCRWTEQTTKGYMWEDIGLDDWLFDLDDESQVKQVAAKVLEMAQNPMEFRERADEAGKFVESRQKVTMDILTKSLYQ